MNGKIKNKLISGVFIVCAIGLGVGIYMYANNTKQTIRIPVLKNELEYGQAISKNNIDYLEVGKFNLPKDIIRKKEDLEGKYITYEKIKGNRFIYTDNVSNEAPLKDVKSRVKYGAIAITTDLSKCVAGTPEKDDYVSISIIKKSNNYEVSTIIEQPEVLKAIRVIEIKENDGVDIDSKKDDEGNINSDFENTNEIDPNIVVLDATKEQQRLLLEGEYNGDIHFTLLPENVQKQLKSQQ